MVILLLYILLPLPKAYIPTRSSLLELAFCFLSFFVSFYISFFFRLAH